MAYLPIDKIKVWDGSDDQLINADGSITTRFPATSYDSFGWLRASEKNTLYSLSFRADIRSNISETKVVATGTASYIANNNVVELTAPANGDKAVLQGRVYCQYTPGNSQLILLTGILYTASNANIITRLGYFDDHNDKTVDSGGDGVFFEYNGTNVGVVIRSYTSGSQVDTRVAQASWNTDKLDGTGTSGVTIDWTKTQMFYIDLQWLGVGTVRYGVVHNGAPIICHVIHNNNTIVLPYMRTASLPIRYEISATGVNTSKVKAICSGVFNEGDHYNIKNSLAWDNEGSPKAITNAGYTHIFTIRKKNAYVRGIIGPVAFRVSGSANTNIFWRFLLNATLTGASYNSVSTMAEIDTTATITNGTQIRGGNISSDSQSFAFNWNLHESMLHSSINGTSDTLTMIAKSSANTNLTVTHIWEEYI